MYAWMPHPFIYLIPFLSVVQKFGYDGSLYHRQDTNEMLFNALFARYVE